jgi:hypothetical protein
MREELPDRRGERLFRNAARLQPAAEAMGGNPLEQAWQTSKRDLKLPAVAGARCTRTD